MPDLALPVVVVRDQAAAAGPLVRDAPAALARRVDLPRGATVTRGQPVGPALLSCSQIDGLLAQVTKPPQWRRWHQTPIKTQHTRGDRPSSCVQKARLLLTLRSTADRTACMPGAPNSDSASAQAWYATCSRRFSAGAGAQTGQIGPVLRFRYPHAPPAASPRRRSCGWRRGSCPARSRARPPPAPVLGRIPIGIDSNHQPKPQVLRTSYTVRRCTLMRSMLLRRKPNASSCNCRCMHTRRPSWLTQRWQSSWQASRGRDASAGLSAEPWFRERRWGAEAASDGAD